MMDFFQKKDLDKYRPLPFWSWNDKLEPEELKRQIQWMNDSGIGGFFMHARAGLKTEYLSEEWMKCIETCCDEAKKFGMEAWAYDENGWPSGFAGGRLLEDMENRDRYITYEIGAFDSAADCSYLLEGEHLVRVDEGETSKVYLNLYIHYAASTVDILNPDVVEKFLTITHCKYKERFGSEFSNQLKGFFTDEPQYYRWRTPYTPMIAKYFMEEYGEDILDSLGLLFVEKEGYRSFRYRYWCSMQKLMLQNFAKKIYKWCDENHIQLTGHYVEEVSMGLQNTSCGGVMPFYEYEHIPGIDWLTRETGNELSPRQLGSAARQLGKKQALTETFGLCGWDVTPAELQRIAGFQYVNGANRMCHHLIPYTERGQRKRDYPAHFSVINPWIKENFKNFNDFFTKLGYLLGEGDEPVNTAVLHPIRSSYFDYKRDKEKEGFCISDLESKLRETCRTLSSRGIAYHFLDETLLESHGFVQESRIGCGNCTYDYLVIPKMLTMGQHTEALLHEFVENGGKILLLDEIPQFLEGEPYDYNYLRSNCTLQEIIEAQPFEVKYSDTELYYAYRMIDGKPFLFVQNNSDKKAFSQNFYFKDGSQSFIALDLVSMKTKPMPLEVTVQQNEGLLLFPVMEKETKTVELNEYELKIKEADVSFRENYMTVDTLCYSKDGIQYSEPIFTRELFQQLLQERYRGKIWLRYEFELRKVPEELSIIIEKTDNIESSINGEKVCFQEPWDEEHSFEIADITTLVHEGLNAYEVILDWYQKEETYYALFGENVTEGLSNCIVYDSEIEPIYLCGKFGVYSDAEFEQHDEETVFGHSFYIGEVPKKINEPTKDGLPFLRGEFTVRQTIDLEQGDVILKVPGRYLTAKVCVNGKCVGDLLFSRQIDISEYTIKGENEIMITYTVGNRNLLGPLHHYWPELAVTPGSFGVCNIPKSIDGKYQYKLYTFYKER